MKQNVETFLGCESGYADAKIVLFGAPFDSTTSFVPAHALARRPCATKASDLRPIVPIRTKTCARCRFLTVEIWSFALALPKRPSQISRKKRRKYSGDGEMPFLLGGEHLVTLGAVRAAAERYPGLHIIHFDAHADLREDYLGARLSHACVMKRCWDLLGDGRIHQFCIRSGEKEEFAFAKEHTDMHRFGFEGLSQLTERMREERTPVYFTVDLDCLDPSAFPGTGTPEAGGVNFQSLLEAILLVGKTNIVGADVNELAPMLDASGASTAVACKVLREMLLAVYGE